MSRIPSRTWLPCQRTPNGRKGYQSRRIGVSTVHKERRLLTCIVTAEVKTKKVGQGAKFEVKVTKEVTITVEEEGVVFVEEGLVLVDGGEFLRGGCCRRHGNVWLSVGE